MNLLDARNDEYELIDIDGNIIAFTSARLDRNTIPDSLFCYDVRDSDDLSGEIAEICSYPITVNHFGTVLSKEPFDIDNSGSYYPHYCNYLGEDVSLTEFLQES